MSVAAQAMLSHFKIQSGLGMHNFEFFADIKYVAILQLI